MVEKISTTRNLWNLILKRANVIHYLNLNRLFFLHIICMQSCSLCSPDGCLFPFDSTYNHDQSFYLQISSFWLTWQLHKDIQPVIIALMHVGDKNREFCNLIVLSSPPPLLPPSRQVFLWSGIVFILMVVLWLKIKK